MLTQLILRHFKCFQALQLPVGQLTLLSGTNAAGKSSVLQALVLLHQTMNDNEWSKRLLFNGGELQLGTITDVVDKVNGRRRFELGVVFGDRKIHWVFEADDRRAMSAQAVDVVVNNRHNPDPDSLHHLLPKGALPVDERLTAILCRLTYLTAERMGPREVYSLVDTESTQVVGPRGEHAVSLLHLGRDEHVLPQLVIPSAPPTRFHQVIARMNQFFPGCSLDIQQIPQTNGVTLGIRTSSETDFHRPIHVGFGLTQVLPVVVAVLSAQEDDIVLIENPEVHLHPAGQAAMGAFLSEVAAAGVQIILETHSDHVLNGVRRAVKAHNIDAEKVVVHFFRDRTEAQSQVVSPTIDVSGNLDSWPAGFFDQFDKDMNYFADWGV